MRWDDLQTKIWTRMSGGQYAWTGIPRDAWLKMRAVAKRMPAAHAFSGLTAAWLLGLDLPWCEPIEVTIGREAPVRARAGVRLRRAALPETDVVTRRSFRSTCALRTVCDLGGRADLVESVVAVDMALRAGLVQRSDPRPPRRHAHRGQGNQEAAARGATRGSQSRITDGDSPADRARPRAAASSMRSGRAARCAQHVDWTGRSLLPRSQARDRVRRRAPQGP